MTKEKAIGLTAVYKKVKEGYVAYVEEIPGANTQGSTLQETKKNLREALRLVLETNRKMAEKGLAGEKVLKEKVSVEI